MSVVRVMPSETSLPVQRGVFFFRLLMLRRKASPTETELRVEYSHVVNEALEMIAIEWRPEDDISSTSTDAHAQP